MQLGQVIQVFQLQQTHLNKHYAYHKQYPLRINADNIHEYTPQYIYQESFHGCSVYQQRKITTVVSAI